MAWHLYARGTASGVYLQNVPFFPTNLPADIRWGFNGIWNVSIITTTSATLEFTLDGGVTWFALTPTSITANQERIVNIKAEDKELFNLRCTDVAGCTLYRGLVSIAPQDIQRDIFNPVNVVVPDPLPIVADSVKQTVRPLLFQRDDFSVGDAEDVIDTGDITPTGLVAGQSCVFEVHVSMNGDKSNFEYTLDGTNYAPFLDRKDLKDFAGFVFEVPVAFGDTFNCRPEKKADFFFFRLVSK